MKRFLFILVFSVLIISANASHIVGGELAWVHVPGTKYTYRVEMILYYDVLNGDLGGDLSAIVRIFSKRTNTGLYNVILQAEGEINSTDPDHPFAIGLPVQYFQPTCSNGSIKTNAVFYKSGEFELSPDTYNDPEGYYLAYERCCRNYSITNIVSDEPLRDGAILLNYDRVAGQTFYLEFPPIIKNGEPFINSSPRLFPPLSDYACPNRPYFVDFAGVDDDGDSLVYSLVTPMNSIERANGLPLSRIPNAGPYDSIIWKPGFSNTNFMNGLPDLKISSDGLLTVRPSINSTGLFVFAVRCEEYRDGIKIGEVRRDFQMLVQNACPAAEPPIIVGKAPTDNDFGSTNQLNLTIGSSQLDINRCFQVKVTDADALKFDDNYSEKVRLKAITIGFKKKIDDILPKISEATISSNGNAIFEICLPKCPYNPNGSFKIGIVVFDDACTLPLSDTLYVSVSYPFDAETQNYPPELMGINLSNNETINGDTIKTLLGSAINISLNGTDLNASPQDHLTLQLIDTLYDIEPVGFSFQPAAGVSPLSASFFWNPDCTIFKNGVYRNNYTFKFSLSDTRCFNSKKDTLMLNMVIEDIDGSDRDFLPPNIFTPNHDNLNDYFSMVKEVEPGVFESILPNDNCVGKFVSIDIFDRWGKEVYRSSNREFKWTGEGMPVGVYYYYLLYSNKHYKGIVTIRY